MLLIRFIEIESKGKLHIIGHLMISPIANGPQLNLQEVEEVGIIG